MKFLTRIHLATGLLFARSAGQWRVLAGACEAERVQCGHRSLLAALAESAALDAELAQVAGGARTTIEAARLLKGAQQLTRPR